MPGCFCCPSTQAHTSTGFAVQHMPSCNPSHSVRCGWPAAPHAPAPETVVLAAVSEMSWCDCWLPAVAPHAQHCCPLGFVTHLGTCCGGSWEQRCHSGTCQTVCRLTGSHRPAGWQRCKRHGKQQACQASVHDKVGTLLLATTGDRMGNRDKQLMRQRAEKARSIIGTPTIKTPPASAARAKTTMPPHTQCCTYC